MEKLPIEQRHGITVPEAAALIGVGKTTMYNWTHIPGFPCVRIGRKILVSRERLRVWFDEMIDNGGLPQ